MLQLHKDEFKKHGWKLVGVKECNEKEKCLNEKNKRNGNKTETPITGSYIDQNFSERNIQL